MNNQCNQISIIFKNTLYKPICNNDSKYQMASTHIYIVPESILSQSSIHCYFNYQELSPLKQSPGSPPFPPRTDSWVVVLAVPRQRTRTWATHGTPPPRLSGGSPWPGTPPGDPAVPPGSAERPSMGRKRCLCLRSGQCLSEAERLKVIVYVWLIHVSF